LPANYSTRNEIIKEPEQLTRFIAKADSKYTYENGLRTINIDDVVISGGASEKKTYSSSFYIPKNLSKLNQLTEKDLDFYQYNNLSEILVYMPFTRIVLDAEEGQDVFRRKVIIERMSYRINTPGEPEFNFATLIVDGVIIQDYDIDDVVNTADIESISVLKGAQASILGGDGAGGAIVITTKKGLSQVKDVPKYNIKKVTPMGYQKPAEFYSPRYETAEQRNNLQPDLRTTIYWNPNIYISSSGEAIFDFFTADASTTYSMLIEGISTDGSIIQNIKKISRK
jgi:TonB-dependent SusC/RagA subfamily outer membrane receptor